MRVLLAGASGAIGRFLVPQLIEAGHEVIGVTRTAGSLAGTGAIELVADVSDRERFLAAVKNVQADAVVHQLSALKKAPLTHHDMRETNRLRVEGTSTLIAAARRVGAERFVAGSVFYGYGFGEHDADLVDESAPFGEPDGRNNAVLTAVQSLDQQVRAFGGVSLRYGLIYEPGVRRVSAVRRSWNGRLPLLHVSDAASAVIAALAKGKPGQAYNIADDVPTSYRDLQFALARAGGLRPPIELPETVLRAAAPFGSQLVARTRIRLSTRKAKAQLGWAPAYPSIAVGLPAESASDRRAS
jgi:nucleoside-diphosphate-sugar epimerase